MATDQRSTTPRANRLSSPKSILRSTLPPISVPTHPAKDISAEQQQRLSLSPKELLHSLASRTTPRPLTGAAALADGRLAKQQKEKEQQEGSREADTHVSHNQAVLALNALMGHQEMSKASDAPLSSRPGQPRPAAPSTISASASTGPPSHTSVTSSQSHHARDAPTFTPTSHSMHGERHFVDEPEDMGDDGQDEEESPIHDDEGGRSFTYPGSGPTQRHHTPSRRDHSVPGSATYDSGAKSAKRHKCPHCATDFTRHHNLKSHLLTHSQEKPYLCQTCSARFRRLHDLKRHAKLHTGERPHICPKCGRKFARGDALARHNKGPGGCANRKSSFGADDDGEGGDDMDGIEYDEQDDERGEDTDLLDDHGRRVSEPTGRKRPHPDTSPQDNLNRRHARTYPPPISHSMRQEVAASMGPPQTLMSPTTKNFSDSHLTPMQHDQQYPAPYYSQSHGNAPFPTPMTESPRPLSPRDAHRSSGGDAHGLRNASPSISSTYQSSHFGSRSSGSLPGPSHMTSHAQQLPSLPGLTAGPQAVQPPAHVAPPAFPPHHGAQSHPAPGVPLAGSNPGSHSSHGHSSSGSVRDVLAQEQQDMFAYVRSLEQRLSRMQDEYELRIARLQADVIDLKAQVYQGR